MVFEMAFGLGALVVGGALVFGLAQYRRRDPNNEALTEKATREIYATTER